MSCDLADGGWLLRGGIRNMLFEVGHLNRALMRGLEGATFLCVDWPMNVS